MANLKPQLWHAPLSNPDNSGERQHEYAEGLAALSNSDLQDETSKVIYMSAWAGNNPRSCFHWQVDACYAECSRRDPGIYSRAYDEVKAQAGMR